jgi:hypothetical protein
LVAAGTDYNSVDARIAGLREQMKGKRTPRAALWVKIGKFAVALWVLGIVAAIVVPNSTPEPGPLVNDTTTVLPDPQPQPTPSNPSVQPDPAPAATNVAPPPSRDDEAAASNLRPYGRPITGSLGRGMEIVHNITLEAGMPYVIAGSCDGNCDELNLAISSNGQVLERNTVVDARPVVTVVVFLSGTFQVTVGMGECAREQCSYRVQAYRTQL